MSAASSDNAESDKQIETHESSRVALRALQQVFQKAVENNTIEDMREHIADDFSFVSFTDKSFDSFDNFEKQWKVTRAEMIGDGRFTSELNPEPALFEGDIAICKGNASNQMVDAKGNTFAYSSNWTVIFKQTAGVWKVLRAHNSLDPFANPMLLSHVKKTVLKYSAVAFIIGGIACSLLTYTLIK